MEYQQIVLQQSTAIINLHNTNYLRTIINGKPLNSHDTTTFYVVACNYFDNIKSRYHQSVNHLTFFTLKIQYCWFLMNIQGDLILNVKLILKYRFVFILIYVKQNISMLVHLSLEIEKNLPNWRFRKKIIWNSHRTVQEKYWKFIDSIADNFVKGFWGYEIVKGIFFFNFL